MRKRAVVLRRASAPSSSVWPGVVNERDLDVGHARSDSGSAARHAALRSASLRCELHLRIEQQRRRKHGPPRKVIAEKRRRSGTCSVARIDCAGNVLGDDRRVQLDAAEAVRRAPSPHSSAKRSRSRIGRIELGRRQHRSEAMRQFDRALAADARPAAVGDRFVVAVGRSRHRVRAAGPDAARRGIASLSPAPPPAGREIRSALIATHAASWPTASATRRDGNARMPAGIANTPRARFPGSSSVMRSTKEKAAKCSSMRGRGRIGPLGITPPPALPSARGRPACRTSRA